MGATKSSSRSLNKDKEVDKQIYSITTGHYFDGGQRLDEPGPLKFKQPTSDHPTNFVLGLIFANLVFPSNYPHHSAFIKPSFLRLLCAVCKSWYLMAWEPKLWNLFLPPTPRDDAEHPKIIYRDLFGSDKAFFPTEWEPITKMGYRRDGLGARQSLEKLMVVGPVSGKTCLIIRWLENRFETNADPTIEDVYDNFVNLPTGELKVKLLDTAGIDAFSAMRDLYFRNGDAFILCFSLTEKSTLAKCGAMIEMIRRRHPTQEGLRHVRPILLVGTKMDLTENRQVSFDGAIRFARKHAVGYLETSAKTGKNVNAVFRLIAELQLTWDECARRDKSLLNR